MAVAYDAAGAGLKRSGYNNVYWNHTVASGSSYLVVAVAYRYSETISSVTWNGATSLDLISGPLETSGPGGGLYLYGKAGLSGTAEIKATFTSAGHLAAASLSFTGVDQADPLGTAATATGSSTSPSVTVTNDVDADAAVVAGVVTEGEPEWTPSGTTIGAVEQDDDAMGTGDAGMGIWAKAGDAGGSVTMNGTLGASNDWAVIGVALRAAAAPAAGGGNLALLGVG